jgi:hypothetical protein
VMDSENVPPPKRSKITVTTHSSPWSITATSKRPAPKAKIVPGRIPAKPLPNSLMKKTSKSSPIKRSHISASQSTLKVKQVIDLTMDSPHSSSSPVSQGPTESLQVDSQSHVALLRPVVGPTAPTEVPSLSSLITHMATDNNIGARISEQNSNHERQEPSNIFGRSNALNQRAKPLRLSKDKSRGKLLCMHEKTTRESTLQPSTNEKGLSQLRSRDQLSLISDDHDTVFQIQSPSERMSRDKDGSEHDQGEMLKHRPKRNPARAFSKVSEAQIAPRATLNANKALSKYGEANRISEDPRVLLELESQPTNHAILNSPAPHQHTNHNNLPIIPNLHNSPPFKQHLSLAREPSHSAGSLRRTQSAIPKGGGLQDNTSLTASDFTDSKSQHEKQPPCVVEPDGTRRTTTPMRRAQSAGMCNAVFLRRPQPELHVRMHARIAGDTADTTHAADAASPASAPLNCPPIIKPLDVGPWSTEALDLFDWRPPDWESRMAKVPASAAMVD